MKTTLLLALLATISSVAAQADDHMPNFDDRVKKMYGSINAGVTSVDDTDFSAAPNVNVSSDYDEGYVVTGEVGYNVGKYFFIDNVKLGAELGYASNDVDSHSVGGTNLAGADGDLNVATLMANMYHEYNTNTRFVPYYGVGIGLGRIDADGYRAAGATALDDDETAFAYQGTLGLNYMLTSSSDIGARYRYLAIEGAEVRGATAGASSEDFDYESHAFTVNYTHNF
jgi:OmpA-OmpF porin, OOP family